MTMQKVEIVLLSVFGLLAVATSKPQFGLPFLTFKDGNFKVNFGGYHAEAGLGGLLTGGRTAGGLHASAGTPFGANAEAGLGGLLDGNGYTGGQLHASAGLGEGNPNAVARIGGEVTGHGSQGASFAGATTGGAGPASAVLKSVESHSYGVAQPSIIGKTIETQVYQSVPNVEVVKTIDTHVSHPAPSLSTRIVETETLVPAQPDSGSFEHIQKVKTRVTSKKQKNRVSTVTKTSVSPSVHSSVVVQKAIYPGTNWHFQKYIETQPSPVQQVYYTNSAPVSASASAGISGSAGLSGGAYGGAYGSALGSAYRGSYGNNYYVKPQPSSQFFDDVFNIPISTLTAVNQLLRNKGK